MCTPTARPDGGYDSSPGAFVTEYDRESDDSLAELLVTAVSTVTDVPPDEIERPLGATVDLDALDALFAPRSDGSSRMLDGGVWFDYMGCTVIVYADGGVVVHPAEVLDP